MFENTILYAESWNVALRKKKTGDILTDRETQFLVINNPLNYWIADPFLFEYDDKTYIFAELYDYIKCRGTLGYAVVTDSDKLDWKQIIIEEFHLSYPCIMRDKDDIYIMAESGGDKSLYLYKATHFPDKWKRMPNIRNNIVLGDTTPFENNKKKLAITYFINKENRIKILDLENEENDYFLNDVNIKIKRPAGKFFHMTDGLYRPAQICENDYGEGIIFYKVTLNENNYYEENEVLKLYPEDINISKKMIRCGMHTYNSTDKYEIIDIKTRRFNFLNLMFRFINKLKH